MDYKIYKFKFAGAVHFGRNSLENAEYTFCSDTLFSALCIEAVKLGNEQLDRLYQYAHKGKLLISDAMPYMKNTYFLPKPMCRIEKDTDKGDSSIKKAYKKLKFIEADKLSDYLNGDYDIQKAPNLNEELGIFYMKVSASIRGEEQTRPYRVATYYFKDGNGLYIILGYENSEVLEFVEELLTNLSYIGIGGERTSGMGRFELINGKMPQSIGERLDAKSDRYMTLSVSLPTDDELEKALDNAQYLLCRRSGFVSSDTYSDNQMRKKDLYVLKAGACIHNRYSGDVYDVSDHIGSHPVYRYAKPMFLKA
jgi:CRISPR-associated protein Csm4